MERNHYCSDFFKNSSKLFCETSLAWQECINNNDELQMQPEVEASPGKTLLLNIGKIQMGIDKRTIKLCLHCSLWGHCIERMNCESISSPFKMYYICISVCVCMHTYTHTHTCSCVYMPQCLCICEGQRITSRVGSLLSPSGPRRSISGHQALQEVQKPPSLLTDSFSSRL